MRDRVTILYNRFETLDVFGPIEMLGKLPDHFNPLFYSLAEAGASGIVLVYSRSPAPPRLFRMVRQYLYGADRARRHNVKMNLKLSLIGIIK